MSEMTISRNSKICLALSGGIDSIFAGWLLKQEGYEVLGVYLDITDDKQKLSNVRIAAKFLDIPLKILNFRNKFHKYIVHPFINAYLSGETPNPCVFCNAIIKCGLLLEWMFENGIFHLATGHYAQIKRDFLTGNYLLLRGLDSRKDQSYFLYRLTQKQLSHLIFPLGHWKKKAVEEQVRKIGLYPFDLRESQEICFLSSNNYRLFLKQKAPDVFVPGPVFDKRGNRIGTHSGLPNYTIGQRKGLQLMKQGPNYILSINLEKNLIIVGTDDDLKQSKLVAVNVNKIISQWPQKVSAQIRSTQPAQEATIEECKGDKVKVKFCTPVRAITPGQSVVFYHEGICIGGGIIQNKT